MKRVFFICRHLNGGDGISTVARLIAKVLDEEAAYNRLIVHSTCLLKLKNVNEFKHISIKSCNGSKLKLALRIIFEQIRNDLLIFDELSYVRIVLCLPFHRKCISYTHGTEIWENYSKSRLKAAQKINFLISNSEYTIRRARRTNQIDRNVFICWLGTEKDNEPNYKPELLSPPTLICIGRMHKGKDKGQRRLIDAWVNVQNALPRAQLLLVGSGDDENDIRNYAYKKGIRNVFFKGFVNSLAMEMEELLKKSWALCLPATMESFGLVYVEAMRNRLPVIGTIHDSASEINVNGESGYNVDIENGIEELSERIIELLSDRELCRKLGELAFNRWYFNFRYSVFRKRYLDILESIL